MRAPQPHRKSATRNWLRSTSSRELRSWSRRIIATDSRDGAVRGVAAGRLALIQIARCTNRLGSVIATQLLVRAADLRVDATVLARCLPSGIIADAGLIRERAATEKSGVADRRQLKWRTMGQSCMGCPHTTEKASEPRGNWNWCRRTPNCTPGPSSPRSSSERSTLIQFPLFAAPERSFGRNSRSVKPPCFALAWHCQRIHRGQPASSRIVGTAPRGAAQRQPAPTLVPNMRFVLLHKTEAKMGLPVARDVQRAADG